MAQEGGKELTPLVEILVPRVGRLIPFLCALKFWLWLVWFLDLAISVSRVRGERGVRVMRVSMEAHSKENTFCSKRTHSGCG